MGKKVDLTGKRFGKLVVVRKAEGKNGHSYFECKCDCGEITTARKDSLFTGNTQSCGCFKIESAKLTENKHKINLTGMRFGRLMAIEETKKRASDGSIIWKCKCDCGKLAYVDSSHLSNNRTLSCGCLLDEFLVKDCVEDTRVSTLSNRIRKNNTSGIKGVSWSEKHQKWETYISLQGTRHNLGYFDKLEDAAKARKEAEEKYFTPILEKYGRGEELNKSV